MGQLTSVPVEVHGLSISSSDLKQMSPSRSNTVQTLNMSIDPMSIGDLSWELGCAPTGLGTLDFRWVSIALAVLLPIQGLLAVILLVRTRGGFRSDKRG